jgi:BlaI family transcriptional regulator, penicillinase repressor
MARPTPVPTNAELDVLQELWRHGPRTVREVHDAIRRERGIGYTTVLKTLQVMAEKGLVTRDETERSHVYRAAVPESAVKRRLVADLVDRAFEGSAAGLVLQALSTRRASPEELQQIRDLLGSQTRENRS